VIIFDLDDDESDRSSRPRKNRSHRYVWHGVNLLDKLYRKFKHFLYTSYYSARDVNYSYGFYPTSKDSHGVSFRSYEILNLHGNDDLLKVMLNDCDDNSVVFDIGANIGTYSLALASKYTDSDIIAIEPNIEVFKKLEMNLESNELDNLKIYNLGISDQDGKKPFYISSYQEASSFNRKISKRWGGNIRSVKKVDVKKLDTFVEETEKRPDRIKLDVEGHGLKVLKGGKQTLEDLKPSIYLERHEVGSEKNEAVLEEFLKERDYSINKRGMDWICLPRDSK